MRRSYFSGDFSRTWFVLEVVIVATVCFLVDGYYYCQSTVVDVACITAVVVAHKTAKVGNGVASCVAVAVPSFVLSLMKTPNICGAWLASDNF